MKDNSCVNKLLKRNSNSCSGTKFNKLTLETLKKFDVDLEKVQSEVVVLNVGIIDYEEKSAPSVFGEKKAISYLLSFVIYNIEFRAKLMTFEYSTRSELLKLDLACETLNVQKELKYCCNSLQRRRNLNLMFVSLIKFSRYLESRRLICDVIFKKSANIETEENKDGGKIIIYSNNTKCLKLAVFWNVECNSQYEVVDKVEAYYKVEELSNRDDIRNTLTQLTEPFLEFNQKYHLWKNLLKLLSKDSSIVHVDCACPSLESVEENCSEASTFEGISIIRHPYLTSERYKIKVEKEEPIDELDITPSSKYLPAMASSWTPMDTVQSDNTDVRLVSVSKTNVTGKDDFSNLNVYKGLLKDQFVVGRPSCSKVSRSSPNVGTSKAPNLYKDSHNPISRYPNQSISDCSIVSIVSYNNTRNPSISISDSDMDSVILLPSDNEVSSTSCRKRNACTCNHLSKQGGSSSYKSNTATFMEVDVCIPKKRKTTDDDLEITSVTYVIPD
ncbi:uncharacterized protein LOC109545114 [Dendroctonus ponderosae]|uniref:uncharacterized protein LOC109545114 n=1 Tax=Dendroctonus ponderosae TaxID=77166 RepID=UPI002036321F|nr:uncharacterized protein LOC109545114 [Dendroctonus ponderosae]KAH1015429.1 hypothetical protein HUJ05_013153 [Dendroctonus ponderosae]